MELVLIFLGEIPPKGINFKKPGAASSARWMAKILYSFKLYMFRDQLRGTACALSKAQIKGLKDFCIFVVAVYVRYWFLTPHAASAPRADLEMVVTLDNYSKIHPTISKVALKKMLGHLWYLSEELVPLSLFDAKVSVQTKREIISSMLVNEGRSSRVVRDTSVTPKDVRNTWAHKSLADFASKRSMFFFERLNLPTSFLSHDPSQWNEIQEYKDALHTVSTLVKVTNEAAERGVALMKEFHDKFSYDEEQKQGVFLMVSYYRKKFPNANLTL